MCTHAYGRPQSWFLWEYSLNRRKVYYCYFSKYLDISVIANMFSYDSTQIRIGKKLLLVYVIDELYDIPFL